jgi:hypothetical protein
MRCGEKVTSTAKDHIVIGSRVPLDFAETVRHVAQAEDRSVGYIIRRALMRELKHVGIPDGEISMRRTVRTRDRVQHARQLPGEERG